MDIKALQDLIAKLAGEDKDTVTDVQLGEAVDAIRAQLADAESAPRATIADRTALIERLRELGAIRDAVVAEQATRAAAASDLDAEAEELLAGLRKQPETPAVKAENTEQPAEGQENGGEGGETPTGQPAAETAGETRELVTAVTAAASALTAAAQAMTAVQQAPAAQRPEGRRAGRITPREQAPIVAGGAADVVQTAVYGGSQDGAPRIENSLALGEAILHKLNTGYKDPEFRGRMDVAHVTFSYPEARQVGTDGVSNTRKIEALTRPQALVAAGGLCAPPDTLYDVEVIGSPERPIRDALVRMQVERGAITYRQNTSAASAVHGAGQWTTDMDADGSYTKGCWEVQCPGLVTEKVWAAYLCLEFSNVTSRFDPETTASNVAQGSIAHARLAENLLLSKMAAGSKILTGTRVLGAARDVIANGLKASTYYRSRHRITGALPLTWILPFWVKAEMKMDIARQMASGDWKSALGLADNEVETMFANIGINPVWHLDGLTGSDEVQTVTITGTPTGGTFTLTFAGQTTAAIAYNATAAQVQTALRALPAVGADGVTVTGGPGPGAAYTVTFDGGVLDGVDVAQMTSSGSFTGGSSPAVAVATSTGGDGPVTVSGVSIPSQTYDFVAAGSPIPFFPAKIDSLMFTPGEWLFLDGGTLDLGLVRDSTLNSRNRYRQFMETFEGVANRGVEPLRLVLDVKPTGQTSGTKDLDSVAA